MTETGNKIQVEIWSDIMCPFCYIGKRKFEAALKQLPEAEADRFEITWKSFQLAPDMVTSPGKTIHQFLADHKGMSLDQAKNMNNQVTAAARAVGLVYDFDQAVPANSLNAHRLSHWAKTKGKQEEVEEKLFEAYFTLGKNVDDIPTLAALAAGTGLDAEEAEAVLNTADFSQDVETDIDEAQQIGVRGVPFFVFDRKYAVSGAQDSAVFLDTFKKIIEEKG